MEFVYLDTEMEMPCPCQHCGDWFDLHDGKRSRLWYPGTIICQECSYEEREEIDSLDEEE